MIKQATSKLTQGKNLSFLETKEVFKEIFNSKTTDSQIAAFLVALKIKGESEEEISAAASLIREKANKINARKTLLGIEDKSQKIIDTCGTGGSGINKFNISTAVAFIVSSAGIKVAKHGNRAMSSNCGSADVLEALGIDVAVKPAFMERAINEVGIAFLYAPLYHPALATVAKVRKELSLRTIFNILGPLCNPALANYQLLGVYKPALTFVLAKVLKNLGLNKALVVCGKDILDEISLTGSTQCSFLNKKKIENLKLNPSNFGLKKIKLSDILAKDAKMSAKIIKDVLNGKKGPARDIVLANASACFYILGKAKNFKEGVKIAKTLIDDKKAKKQLQKFKGFLDKNA